MSMNKQEIINDFFDHFNDIPYSECYIGIASDIDSQLFNNHNVSEENGHWIYRPTPSRASALEIERRFLNAGMDGGEEGRDNNSTIVYAYRKTLSTIP